MYLKNFYRPILLLRRVVALRLELLKSLITLVSQLTLQKFLIFFLTANT